jgi:phosphoethanolamine N-methyltransferase
MAGRTSREEYGEDFIAALQWMWGDGYLSPGGPREVAELLRGVSLSGKSVLDIGCGLGAIDVLLVQSHGAARVVGIDIVRTLVDAARRRVGEAGLDDRIRIDCVEPGPLNFDDASFDVVFSKDSIIHVRDKAALYAEVLRVLEPGGTFVGSDWLRGGFGPYSPQMKEWLGLVHLTFEMMNLDQTRAALEAAGFVRVRLRDRNDWYRKEVRRELATLEGDRFAGLVRRIGKEGAAHRLKSSSCKRVVIDRGELRPAHFVAVKPELWPTDA